MSKSGANKKTTVYKEEETEMIELQDFNQSKNLPIQPQIPAPSQPSRQDNQPPQQQTRPNNNPPPNNNASSNTVRMNGMVFPNQQLPSQQPPKRSKFPEMSVVCRFCTLQQSVAGNSQMFACSMCLNMNQCIPVCHLFICCACKAQVCYQLGVSELIRCTRCSTVNRVPKYLQPSFMQQQSAMQRQIEQQRQEYERIQRQKQQQQKQLPQNREQARKPEYESVRNVHDKQQSVGYPQFSDIRIDEEPSWQGTNLLKK